MDKINWYIIFCSIVLLAGSIQLNAAEHEHEHHEAHIHGEAQLLLAMEDNTLEMELLSPAMNIVGFEHQPENEAQTRAVESAIDALNQTGRIFSFPDTAKCDSVSVEVVSPLTENDQHDHEEEAHSEFKAHYLFRCAEISRLERIEVQLFSAFPGIEVIEVQSISKRGQRKLDLTPEHNTLEL
ncbi:MAG: DUF2796 domain-containing protein [Candidatus Thiodiazotropha endolucinida]